MKAEQAQTISLNEIANISVGYPFRGKIPESDKSDTRVIQLKNVDVNHGINWQSCVKTELTGKKAPYFLQVGDILFSARGGQHAYFIDTSINQSEHQFIASPHFFVITVHSSHSLTILPAYLTLLLNDTSSKRYIEKHAVGTNTKNMSKPSLAEINIPVPSLAYQQAVIAVADNITKQRQKMDKLIKNSEHLVSSLIENTC